MHSMSVTSHYHFPIVSCFSMQVGCPMALGSKHACEGQSEEEEGLKGINNRISALNKE